MHECTARLNYTFGAIALKLGGEGKIDRPIQLANHMLSSATTILGAELVQYEVVDGKRGGEGALKQKCVMTLEFGDIKLFAEFEFDFTERVSKRILNDIVLGSLLPKVFQTAAAYLGNKQSMRWQHREAVAALDTALDLRPFEDDMNRHQEISVPTSDRRQMAMAR
jgi:hypothetical protein